MILWKRPLAPALALALTSVGERAVLARPQARVEQGIAFSNLVWKAPAERRAIIDDVARSGARWFRDGPTSGSPAATATFVEEIGYAKRKGLKVLIVLVPRAEDYDPGARVPNNGGEGFRKRCGWTHGSLAYSRIDLDRFGARLVRLLAALKAAGAAPDAVEIGNEVDWICFNGDVPDGRPATEGERHSAALAYARFLRRAAITIRAPRFFPQARIITFGMANVASRWDRPPHHLDQPAAFLKLLSNLDGIDYLENDAYRVEGFGVHLYPGQEEPSRFFARELGAIAATLGRHRPFWITEWGLPPGSRSGGIDAAANAAGVPLGPVFRYTDNARRLHDEATRR